MNDSFSLVVSSVIEALPDSVSSRRQILTAVIEILPDRHPMRSPVRALLFSLNQHEGAQREFPFTKPGGAR